MGEETNECGKLSWFPLPRKPYELIFYYRPSHWVTIIHCCHEPVLMLNSYSFQTQRTFSATVQKGKDFINLVFGYCRRPNSFKKINKGHTCSS